MRVDIEKAISLDELKTLSFVEKVYLYGSRAKNTHRDRSDIDIAVDCPTATDAQWLEVLDIIEDSPTLLKVDCIRLDVLKSDSRLFREILTGIVLYDARKAKK